MAVIVIAGNFQLCPCHQRIVAVFQAELLQRFSLDKFLHHAEKAVTVDIEYLLALSNVFKLDREITYILYQVVYPYHRSAALKVVEYFKILALETPEYPVLRSSALEFENTAHADIFI